MEPAGGRQPVNAGILLLEPENFILVVISIVLFMFSLYVIFIRDREGDSSRVSNLELSSEVILLRSFFAFPVISSCWRREVIRRSAARVCLSRIGPYLLLCPRIFKCKSKVYLLCVPWDKYWSW